MESIETKVLWIYCILSFSSPFSNINRFPILFGPLTFSPPPFTLIVKVISPLATPLSFIPPPSHTFTFSLSIVTLYFSIARWGEIDIYTFRGRYLCSKYLLHNNFVKVYPGSIRELSIHTIHTATIPWHRARYRYFYCITSNTVIKSFYMEWVNRITWFA